MSARAGAQIGADRAFTMLHTAASNAERTGLPMDWIPTQWISDHGYWVVLGGTLFEGEVVLLLAGFAVQQGILSLPAVLGTAFIGAVLGDEAFYFLGRRFGASIIARWHALQTPAARVTELLHRYHAWVIVGVRFAYGLRIVGPIVIGASAVPVGRFLFFNALGAAIWAPLVCGAGYVFGGSMVWLLARAGWVEVGTMLAVFGAITLLWFKHGYKRD